jgi:hypothetical protein
MSVIDHVLAVNVPPLQAAKALEAAILATQPVGAFEKQAEQQIGEMMFTIRWLRGGVPPVALDLTFDSSVPMLMVSVICDDDAIGTRISEQLLHEMNTLIDSPTQLRDAAAASPDDPTLLVRAAVAFAYRFDGRLFTLIDDALRSSQSSLRQAGAKAAALVKYGPLLTTLRHAVKTETDESTARMLALAMSKCQGAPGA